MSQQTRSATKGSQGSWLTLTEPLRYNKGEENIYICQTVWMTQSAVY